MRRRGIAGLLAAACLALPARAQDRQSFDVLERGRYLTTVGDCQACHTRPGGEAFAGGRELRTPFGTLLTPNITPDRETGIGDWSTEQVVRAVREGIGRDGEHLYPGLPYPYYTRATPDDVAAIRAYLATLPAVRNRVVSNQLPFPFSIRAALIGWNALNFTPGAFQPRPDRDAAWNRGAYLVTGLGHCGACHTPKDWLGGDKTAEALQGGQLEGWHAPAIGGGARRGIGGWSEADIAEYLKTGRNAHAAATGSMRELIEVSTSRMTDADLRAIAVYLKAFPGPAEPAVPLPADDPRLRRGEAIYADQCAACHTRSGEGLPRLFPSLRGGPQIQAADPATLIRVLLEGAQSAATDAAPVASAMPAFGWKLGDAEAADVLSYIRNAWGNAAPAEAPEAVGRARKALAAAGG